MKKCRFLIYGIYGLLFTLPPTSVHALEHVITQGENKFSEFFVKLENNDVIKFVNTDSVSHKLTFTFKEYKEIFSELSPGMAQVVEFSRSGVYDIQCDIHPDMKLTVYVPHVNLDHVNRVEYVF